MRPPCVPLEGAQGRLYGAHRARHAQIDLGVFDGVENRTHDVVRVTRCSHHERCPSIDGIDRVESNALAKQLLHLAERPVRGQSEEVLPLLNRTLSRTLLPLHHARQLHTPGGGGGAGSQRGKTSAVSGVRWRRACGCGVRVDQWACWCTAGRARAGDRAAACAASLDRALPCTACRKRVAISSAFRAALSSCAASFEL